LESRTKKHAKSDLVGGDVKVILRCAETGKSVMTASLDNFANLLRTRAKRGCKRLGHVATVVVLTANLSGNGRH
jgi:hypothetical protein